MPLSVDLSDRPVLVTGASGALGGHCARTLAAAGAPVALAARRLDRLEVLVREIEVAGGRAIPVAMDVSDSANVAAAVAGAWRAIGPLRVLVNGSGIAARGPALDAAEADFDAVLAVNLKGPWLVSRAVARHMIEAGTPGSIVNITSILATETMAGAGAYAASKAGLAHLTRCMAVELARHGIRVNALAPGYIATELNQEFLASTAGEAMVKRVPQRRLGTPADLDGALLLLASDASELMTGATLVVDGGHSVAPA